MLIIQQDSREQEGKHKHVLDYFEQQGIKVVRSKLYVGDYTLATNQSVCIDTKSDVLELFMNLTKDHVRFRDECIRAQEAGIKLIVLIEEPLPPGGLSEWKSPVFKSNTANHKKGQPVTQANPSSMKKAMGTMHKKYGVIFAFCNKESSGKVILKILSGVCNQNNTK